MVALNLLDALQLDKYEIIGVSPRGNELNNFEIEIISPARLLRENSSDFDYFDFILNFARGNNSFDSKIGINKILEKFANKTKYIINSSTYAQHYQNPDNKLTSYLTAKQKISKFLSSPYVKSEVFDLSFYTLLGKYDKVSSLISILIPKLLKGEEIFLTQCEQYISYTDVSDVVLLLKKLIEEPKMFVPGAHSFWPMPPVKLRIVIEELIGITESKSKINYGTVPYSGHELFKYMGVNFPPQIIPDFEWKSLKISLFELASSYKI